MSSLKPTYGELIEMLQSAEREAKKMDKSVSELLALKFHSKYSYISIGRHGRFHDTVQRIAAPTRSSRGVKYLNGSPLRSYLKRVWMPRIRNKEQGTLSVEVSK